MAYNLKLIGWSWDDMDDDEVSPFNRVLPLEVDSSEIPPSLRPTKVQSSTVHHPWLDFIPLPKMRDILIQAGDNWDDEKPCLDIMGFWGSSQKPRD